MLHIGNLKIENDLIMAPMAGITNLPFRLMVKGLGAGLVTTEMVSAMGLMLNQKKTMGYIKSDPEEKPLAVQIFGAGTDVMALAANMVAEAGADIVDINMGCPTKKVTRTGAGAFLLRDLRKAEKIITAVRQACPVPLTIKIRAGWSPGDMVACEIARVADGCGVDAVTIHARFATQGYSGHADWRIIEKVKESVNIPVIGNGDVLFPSDALKMRKLTGCDGVMIGRAAVRNPWIFEQIIQMKRGLPFQEPDLARRKLHIMDHFRLLSDSMGEHNAAFYMRGLLLRYSKGLPNSSFFRENITRVKDLASLVSTMDSYFNSLEEKRI